MGDPDLNLLPALDALLRESSVAGAARALGLSESAMSRTLLRLRAATGDALLVRAGRRLVPTPHALALQDRVHALADDARAVLRPATGSLDLRSLDRELVLRANEGFVETFAARLVAVLAEAAPGVRLRFAPKPDKGVQALRDGSIDLEIGVLGNTGPEVKVQALFQDRFIGVVRKGHALASGEVTPERYAACAHVVASRRGRSHGPVDEALAALGLARRVAVTVPSFPAALAVAAASELVGLVTRSFLREGRNGATVHDFALPVPTAPVTVSQMWHPRLEADPVHRWLRETVLSVCRQRQPGPTADHPRAGSPLAPPTVGIPHSAPTQGPAMDDPHPWHAVLHAALKANGVRLFVYVPDRVLTPLIQAAHADTGLLAFAATREEEALGIVAGAWMGGMLGVLAMQTSGFATLPNALASLPVPYQIPLLMVISERGTLGEFNLGQVMVCRTMRPVLDALGIEAHTITRLDELAFVADRAIRQAVATKAPVALILSPLLTAGRAAHA